jgi:hypothetical protein
MSYYVLGQEVPASCGPNEHFDWETNRCAPGLCPPGSKIGASGNCEVDYGGSSEEPGEPESPDEPSSGGGGQYSSSRGGSYAPYPGSGSQQASVLGSAAGAFLVAGVVIVAGLYFWRTR